MPMLATLSYDSSSGHFPVIGHVDPTAVCEAGRADTLHGKLGLWLAQGYAMCLDAVCAGGVHDQTAPAAADVQQSLTFLQAEFSADIVQFA